MKKGKLIGKVFAMAVACLMIASMLSGMFAGVIYAGDSDVHDNYDLAASETNNIVPCVPCAQSTLNLSENLTNSDWSTKPVIVNIQVDLENEGDQLWIYDILSEIEKHGWRTTVFATGQFASSHPELIRDIQDKGHEIAVHGWQEGEDLTLLNYADQLSLIGRAFAAVRGPVSKPEEVVDFKPQGYKFNDDTIRIAQELGAKSVSGIFTCQEPFCKCPYAQKLGKITFPYPVTDSFWLVPISEVSIDSEDTPLDDEYINNPQEFLDYLIGKYTEQLQTKDPLIIAIHPSITGADAAKLNVLSQFVDYVTNNNGKIKPLSSLTHLTTYIPSLQITSAPQSASPGETVTITVQFGAAIYCPSYYFRIYGKYPSENYWTLRAEHYHGVQTGTFSFSRSFAIPEPPAGDSLYTIRVVGQGCSGTCWPTPYSYERMDEIAIGVQEKGFIWPVKGRITSGYLAWEQFRKDLGLGPHEGIDINGSLSGKPVRAVADGKVVRVRRGSTGLGNNVIIDHQNGVFTLYAHLASIDVEPEEDVEQGEVIGKVGDTGLTTGPHLHFGVYEGYYDYYGTHVDPMKYLPAEDPPTDPISSDQTGKLGYHYSDYGMDTDGDGLYDYLMVEAGINITTTGVFGLKGWLTGSNESRIIGWAQNYTYLDLGNHEVQLHFKGVEIRAHRLDGAYNLTLSLSDEYGNQIDYQANAYTTSAYNYTDFQVPWAELTNYYLDYGVDANNDGLFDYLTVEVGVNATSEGNYSIAGILSDANDKMVAWSRNSTYFDNGLHTMQLPFDGRNINVSGGYTLRAIYLYGEEGILLDYYENVYITSGYDSTDFQPSPVQPTGCYLDYGTDEDANGSFDYLTVEVAVNITSSGNYSMEGMLYDGNGAVVAWAYNHSYRNATVQVVLLSFDGMLIFDHGVNGPYNLSLTIHGENGFRDYQSDVYTTTAYEYIDFEQGSRIAGLITDTNGTPVSDAYITVSGPEFAIAFTDTSGSYTIAGLKNGIYNVSVSAPPKCNLLAASTIVNLTTGETTFANFTLQYGGTITGTVTDNNGNPAADVYIYAIGPITTSTVTDINGSYNITGLQSGSYTIRVEPLSPNLMLASTSVFINAGQTLILDFTLQTVGSIAGNITDADGIPIPNVSLYLSGYETARYRTDDSGHYVIPRLQAGTYTVNVDASETVFTDASATVSVVLGQTTTLDFILPVFEGGQIAGRVTDEDGNGVYNAYVSVSGPSWSSGYTNATGYYFIPRLLAGYYTVSASPPYGVNLVPSSTTAEVVQGETTSVDFALQPGGIISGRVTDENGEGISWAYVYADGPCYRSTYTDEDGYYTIFGLPSGEYTVYAEPPYGVNLIRSSTTAEVIQGETTIVNFILQVGGMITGRVTDEADGGVSDAFIYASGPGYGYGYADEDGYYTISGLPSGTYTVTAEAPYGINLIRSSTTAEVIQGETTIVNFVLQVGGMITGRVTDEADVGVSDAYIYADGPGYGYGYADENGYYSITGLQGGTYIVTARPPYGVNLVPSSTTTEVIQGETTIVDFVLQVGGIITGRVTDEADGGVSDAYVYASGPGYEGGYTDEEGYYTIFGLPSGTYIVEAYPPYGVNLVPDFTTAEVIQGESTTVDFVLQAGGIITGRVTDETDVGVSDVYVYASGPSYRSGYTDEDGYYSITGLQGGTYTVTAEPPYGVNLIRSSTTAEVIQGETTIVDFVLQVGGMITGRVTDEADVGVFDAYIYASGPGYEGGYTDEEGYYTIFGLPSGTYIVEAYPPYGVNLVSDFTTAEVVQGETTTVDFVLQVGGIITGRVTDEAGVGVFDVYIYASGPGYGYGYTDEEGYYSIAGLQAGTHTIYIDAIGYGSWYIFVDGAYATYDTCVTVGVTLEQTTFVDFSQQPPNQAPVANAGPAQTVCIIPPASTAMVTLDGSGSYDADGDPLTYTWSWDGNTAYGVSPTVELLTGTTTINLVVNDGKVDSEPDTVDITVQIPATIDFVPDALNLEAKGKYVTAYIELPPGYDVSQIDVSSIRLNDNVPALGKPVEIGDYDNDGLPDLMVKFHRTMVQDALAVDEEVGVTITGEVNEIIFEGGDAIRVITAAAAHGRGEWTRVSTPTIEGWVLAPNSVIVDYAVADDGDVAYAIVYSYDTSQFHLLKSTDGAATWEDIMGALEEEADGDINWLVAVATDAEDADFVAVALEMTDISVHVFISDDGGATFEDAGEVEDGGVYFPDGYYVSDLEVSPEVDGERDIAIGGMDWSGALLFRSTVTGDSAGAWEDTTDYLGDYPGWDDDGAFDSELVTDIVFCPSWAADKTILVVTATDTAVYLQSGTWGTSEGWNADSILAIDAVPILENIDIPMWLADFDAKAIAGITVPMDYSGRNSNSRYAWVWVNYYDEYDCPIGEIMRVKNKSVMEVNQQIEDLPWLTNVSYQGTIAEGEAIAGLLGTGTYDPVYGSPEDLIAACCEGVQVYRNDNIVQMDICCVPWEAACKPPTGTFAMAVSYVGEDKAYAVSLWGFFSPYDEDAWSVSFDDGDFWNQLSLVDTHIDYLSDVAVSPDCNKTMLVSVNDDNGCGCDSVWLHAENLPEAPEYSGKWLRTWCGQLEGHIGGGWERGLLRLAPEETTGDTVYLFDYSTDNVYWNEVEGLACWDFGSASVDDIVDLAVLDKETIYALDYNGDVAMSDDFAIGWQEEVDSEVANGYTIAVWGDYVLVGGEDGDVSYSDDGGETFTELEDVATSGFVTVAFDSYFDANDTIYAAIAGFEGSSPTTGGIYRWVIGESDEWENLDTENYAYTGLALNIPSGGKPKTSADTGGVLYASYVNGDTTGVARCLTPAEDVCCSGTDWDYLTRGLTSELFKMTPQALKICSCLTLDIGSRLFAIDGSEPYDMEEGKTGTVWSFED